MRLLPFHLTMAFVAALLSPAVRAADSPPASALIFRNLVAGKPQTVVVYGTSLTHGGEWANATKKWFDSNYPGKVTFINSGGPGQNSDWGLANLKSKVLDHKPDLVFIEFSFNDAHQKFKMPVERGASNLSKIVEAIHAEHPMAAIVLQIMNVPWDAPNGKGSSSNRPDLEAYNENYRNLARSEQIPLLDHYATWKKLKESDPTKYQSFIPDGTHPGSAGSLAVTWPTIQAWLEAASSPAPSQLK